MTKIDKYSRKLYKQVRKSVIFLRRQEYCYAMSAVNQLLEEYQQLIAMFLSNPAWMDETGVSAENLAAVLKNLLAAQQNEDYILLADLLEMQIAPFLWQLSVIYGQEPEWDFGHFMKNFKWLQRDNPSLAQELFETGNIGEGAVKADAMKGDGDDAAAAGMGDVEKTGLKPVWDKRREELLEKGYVPEYSEDGSTIMSCEDARGRFYFHTNTDVVQEAQILAQSWFSGGDFDFVLYGLGLGHHIEALQEMQKHICIDVYEGNMDVIFMALCFSDMNQWDTNRIRVHIDRDLQAFSRQIKETLGQESAEVVIHYPSMRALPDDDLRSLLWDYYMQYSSAKSEFPLLQGNFFRNGDYRSPSVWELQEEFSGRDVYVVAAGPSLDKNVEYLRNVSREARIVATGTVLKKLLNLGIRPHYVIIIDGGEGTYKQIDGVCECGVPLLYMATVNHDIVKDYHAEKYVIYQQGFAASERAAAERGVKTVQTGGSVSTTALDMLLQFGAGRIIYLGLDLSFPGNLSHCADTVDRHVPKEENICMVDAIDGGKVPCGRNLNAYRKWIERRLAQGCGDTEVINATEGGANIRGMKNKKMQDVCI